MVRRRINVFNLSFLDVMACGLGAVVLLFVIINHAAEVRSDELTRQRLAEVNRLEREVITGKKNLVELKNTLRRTEEQFVIAQGLSRQVIQDIEARRMELAKLKHETLARQEHANALKADLKSAEKDIKRLEASRGTEEEKAEATRTFIGEGDRQYLTGLKVGGKRILILVDASASMLDETLVNVIRRRNLPDRQKIKARKWQRAMATVDWLTTQIPIDSTYQIYSFNVSPTPAIDGTDGEWLPAHDVKVLNQAVRNVRQVIPKDGTSLYNALAAVKKLKPLPDNIYLITDSLPTQGKSKPRRRTVSGTRRLSYLEDAVNQLPRGIPINTILFPMEGDPRAASAYWQLAQVTGGSFISPAKDWP
jgi:hypothetical protein